MESYIVTGVKNAHKNIIARDLSFSEALALTKQKANEYDTVQIEETHEISNTPDKFLVVADCNMHLKELKLLLGIPKHPEEQVVFLGNYVSDNTGFSTFLSYLVKLTKNRRCVFVKGKNEHNLLEYIHQTDRYIGNLKEIQAMIRSIEEDLGFPLYSLPEKFPDFYHILSESIDFYENDRYIFVSGGLDLSTDYWRQTPSELLLETTEDFLLTPNETGKKIVFGDKSVRLLNRTHLVRPWFNMKKDKIGINGDCKENGKLLGMFIYEDSTYYLGIRNKSDDQSKNKQPALSL